MQWMEKEAQLYEKIMSQKQKIGHLQSKLEENLTQSALKKNSSAEIATYRQKVEKLEEALLNEKKKVKVSFCFVFFFWGGGGEFGRNFHFQNMWHLIPF